MPQRFRRLAALIERIGQIQMDVTVDGILYLHARLLPGNLDRLPTRLGQDLFQVVRGIFDEIIPARFALRSLSFCSRVCL